MRIFVNLLITAGLLLLFHAFGWLTVKYEDVGIDINHLTWHVVGSVVVVAFIVWVASAIVELLYLLLGCFTLGLIFLAYPLMGWATLELIAYFMPDTLEVQGFWVTALAGFLLTIVKIHPKSRTSNNDEDED